MNNYFQRRPLERARLNAAASIVRRADVLNLYAARDRATRRAERVAAVACVALVAVLAALLFLSATN